MARKPKADVLDKAENQPQKFDQAAIDAALAGAVTMGDGSPVPSLQKNNPPTPLQNESQKSNEEGWGDKKDVENCKNSENEQDKKCESIATDRRRFGEDCYNFNIDAKKCHYQSAKNEDKSIMEYVRAINKKIYDETCNGGFSTNIQFRVTPQDWVNVTHIIDWYRARGFEVIVKETTSAAYGKDVGTMNHNFTISWAVVG